MKIIHYAVVIDENPMALVSSVNTAIRDGLQPFGTPFPITVHEKVPNGERIQVSTRVIQAMVKYE